MTGTRRLQRTRTRSAHVGSGGTGKIRYAVVGLGHIAQAAVLPAFAHAGNSELVAMVSGDGTKLKKLGSRYRVNTLCDYKDYRSLLESGKVDAVYVALPNSMHRAFVEPAAHAGVHVLCEKPLAVTVKDCTSIVRACKSAGVKLMTAYRLHFEAANLEALRLARSGELGELRVFDSVFTMQVKDTDNVRLDGKLGGGPLHDIGIYCINAARSLFADEPREVFAFNANSGDKRFREVDETVGAIMKYAGGRLATFTCSFGAADVSHYRLVGAKGSVCLEPAFEYAEGLRYTKTINGKSRTHQLAKRDQFAAELVYFSKCILSGRDPEPSGDEGLADVRVIEALEQSMKRGAPIKLAAGRQMRHPRPSQQIDRPPVRKRRHVKARSPSGN